jgi:protein gp37
MREFIVLGVKQVCQFAAALLVGDPGIPLRWKKPKKIFVNSMSDLFHERVPDLNLLFAKFLT